MAIPDDATANRLPPQGDEAKGPGPTAPDRQRDGKGRYTASEATRVQRHIKQILQANKVHDAWQDRFKVQRLENYWEGYQWSGFAEEVAAKKYCINLVFSAMETRKPSLLFFKPEIKMLPRPGRERALISTAVEQAKLCEDTVQTFMDDPDVEFALNTALALHETFFRFGVVEVGYSADYLDNPNAGKPVLQEDSNEPVTDGAGKAIAQPEELIEEERLYVKWIPASSFRVSISDKNSLTQNDWVGYYEWHYVEDVKRNPDYKNTQNLKPTGAISDKIRPMEDEKELEKRHGMVRLWKLWDVRRKVKHVIADGHEKYLVEGKPYGTLPFAVLKFHERTGLGGHFYPLPPVYNWLSPQDEYNESREQQRIHRRRFNRRYLLREGTVDPTELDKLESGEDGVYGIHKGAPGEQPLQPVPDAPLDANIFRFQGLTQADFNQIAGAPSLSQPQPKRMAATTAALMNQYDRLRETSTRQKVALWLADIARLMLLIIRENMSLEIWVKRNTDPQAPSAPLDTQRVALLWQKITAEDLGDVNLDVSVDLASMSPVTEDQLRALWNQLMALIANPAIAMLLANSDVLLRKTCGYYMIHAEQEIQEVKKATQAIVQGLQAMAAAKGQIPGVTAMGGQQLAGQPSAAGMGGMPLPGAGVTL